MSLHQQAALCVLHPATISQMKKGHPWVTWDKFSAKFPKDLDFVIGKNNHGLPTALILNDPSHPKIAGRLWSTKTPIDQQIHRFEKDLTERLEKAFQRRIIDVPYMKERDNVYLCFGETDFVPGLYLLRLGNVILIQSYCGFWENKQRHLARAISKAMKPYFQLPENFTFLYQFRNKQQQVVMKTFQVFKDKNTKKVKSLIIDEFDVKYKVKFGSSYDHGLYTDMANIRKLLAPKLKEKKSFLNLYSYTGAWSLFALKNSVSEVVSVDLSRPYLDWLEENLQLNKEQLPIEKHQSICAPVDKTLLKMAKDGKSFDAILCDPPSASTDGKKKSQALKKYRSLIKQMDQVLNPNGEMYVFLNTHSIGRGKFRSELEKIIKEEELGHLEIIKSIKLSEDCPQKGGFPEGDYLKGFIIKKKDN